MSMFTSPLFSIVPFSLLWVLLLPVPALAQDPCGSGGDFVHIPAGSFIQGSDDAERDYGYQISAVAAAPDPSQVAAFEEQLRQRQWFEGEMSRQDGSVSDFCISRFLVTNIEYQLFVRSTGCSSPGISASEYQAQGFLVHPYSRVEPYLWTGSQFPLGEGSHPVVLVSYEDAVAYAAWLGARDGYSYRLPTAAEWEKAARGTDGRYFPWGDEWRDDGTNWQGSDDFRTSVVGSFPLSQSVYGVEDMAGNVFEFTSTLRGSGEQARAVMKGCSWDDLPGFCRAAYQHTRPVGSRHILFGFRLVREIESGLGE